MTEERASSARNSLLLLALAMVLAMTTWFSAAANALVAASDGVALAISLRFFTSLCVAGIYPRVQMAAASC